MRGLDTEEIEVLHLEEPWAIAELIVVPSPAAKRLLARGLITLDDGYCVNCHGFHPDLRVTDAGRLALKCDALVKGYVDGCGNR